MTDVELKVGELAERTGLTVRTLHWYDEIGLLSPDRTRAGHRVYGPEEVERLQRILSLRHVGLSLDEIREALDRPGHSLLEVLELHAETLAEEARRLRALRDRLHRAIDAVRRNGRIEAEALIHTMEAMAMFEKYYTPEQLETLQRRKEEVGEERIRRVQEEWRELYRRLGEVREAGADPGDPEVRELARKAESLIREFTGGDTGIRASLEKMYRVEGSRPMEAAGWDVDPDVQGFLGRAMKAAREEDDTGQDAVDVNGGG